MENKEVISKVEEGMPVGAVYRRKGIDYKIVSKVEDENRKGFFVYLVAVRRKGEDNVDYIAYHSEFPYPQWDRIDYW